VKPTVREATQNSSHLKGRLGSIVLLSLDFLRYKIAAVFDLGKQDLDLVCHGILISFKTTKKFNLKAVQSEQDSDLGEQDGDRFSSRLTHPPPPTPPKKECKQAISMCMQVAFFISWLLWQLQNIVVP